MEIENITDFIKQKCISSEKKIIEIKLGKIITENVFDLNIDENYIRNFMAAIPKKTPVKYFYNTVYYYKNMQLIVNENGLQKCYEDYGEIYKKDFDNNKNSVRVIIRNRRKKDLNHFSCQKKYNSIVNRELISISLKDNLKINIYNKSYEKKKKKYFEVSAQYLLNKNKINDLEKDILLIFRYFNNDMNFKNSIDNYFK